MRRIVLPAPAVAPPTLAGLLLGLALVTAAGAEEKPAFAGAAEIRLGDDVQSVIAGLPGEVHHYTFFATKGTRVRAKLVSDKGTSLLADLRLTHTGGDVIARATRVSASDVRRMKLAEHTFETSGFFVLELRARSGSGGYTLLTDVRKDRRIRGLDPSPEAYGTWRFEAPGSSLLNVKIRVPNAHRRGSGPEITGLLDPTGAPVGFTARTRGQRATAKGIALAKSGTYTLEWANPGRATRLRFAFDLAPLGGGPRDLFFPAPGATAPTAPELVPPTLAGRDGYVGSRTCGRCHDALFMDWSRTAHNLGSREWQRGGLTGIALVNDFDGNGRNDFEDGLDLADFPAFAEFGDDAPRLSWEPGAARPARVNIGDAIYEVERSMGGNGLHQQAYVARIGDALYPLPFQYDEDQATYTTFETEFWFTETGARYAGPQDVGADVSYEARCAGCHATGLIVQTRTSGEIVAGWSEPDVGCEQCHGPGAEHANSGDPDLISNPSDLLDLTAAGVAAANATCTRCHDRGHGVDAITGSSVIPSYPYDGDRGVAEAGDDLDEFFDPTTAPEDFIGYKTSLVAGIPGDGFVAARTRYLQGRENDAGHHAPTVGFAPTCFECHSPHARERDHMLAPVVDRGAPVEARLEDNSYCLACHARFTPFLGVSKTDVQAIASGVVADSIITATTQHMADAGMSVAPLLYDPAGSGVGRCDTCHMPRTAGEGATGTDAAGWTVRDHAGHGFTNVWPRASELYGTTNSCNACHPTHEDDPVQPIIEEWATPGPDGDTTFHADTPRSFQNGLKNPGNNQGGLPCVQCHTTEGFVAIQVRGERTDQDDWDEMLAGAIARDEGITCRACHGKDSAGELTGDRQPLRFPKNELCGRCHNDETVKFGTFRDDGEIVRHPQREMLLGTAGAEVPGSGAYSSTMHSLPALLPDGCVSCHFDHGAPGEPEHGFQPRTATCAKCHDGFDDFDGFDRPAFGDYDGNGLIEGIQSEVSGLLDVVVDGLLSDPLMSFDGHTFNYGESTDGSMTGASVAQKRAAFNHYTVVGDASLGVHNAIRTVQLLQRSYEEVTGSPVPGADLR